MRSRESGWVDQHNNIVGKLTEMAKKIRTQSISSGATPSQAKQGGNYWLLKSEPDVFSWDMLAAKGDKGEPWTGVRNYQARNNMRAMKLGDLGFFYHSNIGKEVAGICEVIALAHPDATAESGTWECVDVRAFAPLPKPVTLDAIKLNEQLANMVLVKNSRLSVQPVTAEEWAEVCRMGGVESRKLRAK